MFLHTCVCLLCVCLCACVVAFVYLSCFCCCLCACARFYYSNRIFYTVSLFLCLWLSLSSRPNWLGQQQQHHLLLLFLSCTLTFKVGWTILAQINGPTSNAAVRGASGMSSLGSAASQLLLFSRFNKMLLLLQWLSDHWPHIAAAATAAPKSNYAT